MRNCEEVLELISAALDGALTDGEQRELDAHLNACPVCSALYAELSALHKAAGEPEEAPAGFAQQVMCRIAAAPEQDRPEPAAPRPKIIPWRRWASLAAVAAIVVLAAVTLPSQLRLGSGSSDTAGRSYDAPENESGSGEIELYDAIEEPDPAWDDLEVSFATTAQADAGAGAVKETNDAESSIAAHSADAGALDIPKSEPTAAEEASGTEPINTVSDNGAGAPDIPMPKSTPPPPEPDTAEVPGSAGLNSITYGADGSPPDINMPESVTTFSESEAYCGILVLTDGPLEELERCESFVDDEGNLCYLVPAEDFYAISAGLEAENGEVKDTVAGNGAEYGLIIVESLS